MSSSHSRLVNIITTQNSVTINPEEVAITDVQVNTNPSIQRNTKCTVSATSEGRFKGAGVFFYNRLDLAKVFYGQLPQLEYPLNSRITYQEVAEAMAVKFGIDLRGEDVEQSGSILLQKFPFDFDLVATPGSYCVIGQTKVRIVEHVAEVSEAMGVRTFAGLNPPSGDLTKRQGVLYSWDWSAPIQLRDLLTTAYHADGFITADVVPYFTQMGGDNWVFDTTAVQPFNAAGAKVLFIGSRDDHPQYANSARSDTIAVVRLTELCGEVGGDLVISI